jgi:phosphatidylinositol glycan class N
MTAFTRWAFLATAITFHLVYILSIFDIYFVSPVVSGMRLFGVERPPGVKAPADRLVLFVGTSISRKHLSSLGCAIANTIFF